MFEKKFHPTSYRFLNIIIVTNTIVKIGVMKNSVMSANYPEVVADHEANLSSSKKQVL